MEKTRFFETNNLELFVNNDMYYCNNEPLVKQDGLEKKNYTESEFELEIRKNVSQFVNRSFENIVLLVGAGASVVMDENDDINPNFGKTVSMIADIIFDKLNLGEYQLPDDNDPKNQNKVEVFTLEEMAKNIGYDDNIIINDANGRKLSPKFNLEDFLSRLITYNRFVRENKEKWENSQSVIFDIIKEETSYEYEKDIFHHTALINILSKKLLPENKLSVVTTNYDTLIEDAAESINYTVFDGFSFSRTPKFDDDMFEWHLSKHVSNVKTKENIYKKQVIDLLKIHGSLTWRKRGSNKNIFRLDKNSPGQAVMIFPSSDKYMQSYEEPYFELFARFQDLLKRPNTLLITTGFSFADNHISRMIIQAISHNSGLYTLISDYSLDLGQPNKNWLELQSMMHDSYPIAFLRATLNKKMTSYLGEIE